MADGDDLAAEDEMEKKPEKDELMEVDRTADLFALDDDIED